LIKIKGSKKVISFKELYSLLIKNSKLKLIQEKWDRNFIIGRIKVKDEIYTLSITENKRKIIYNENNKFIDTSPIILNNGKIVVSDSNSSVE
jgi:hypothetical protein